MKTVTDVQASFGSCCFFAAAAMAVDSSAEAKAVVTDVKVSGSSYSSCAAAVTITASDASDPLIRLPNTKKAGTPAFFVIAFLFFAGWSPARFVSVSFCLIPGSVPFSFFSADTPHPVRIRGSHL